MLVFLVAVVAAIPMIAPMDVVRMWNTAGAWSDLPRNAAPEWIDYFSDQKLARSIFVEPDEFQKAESDTVEAFRIIILRAKWNFEFDEFPREVALYIIGNWSDRKPIVTLRWQRPDGQIFSLWTGSPIRQVPLVEVIDFGNNQQVISRVRSWAVGELGANDVEDLRPRFGMHAVVDPEMLHPNRAQVLKGEYTLFVEAIVFNKTDQFDARYLSLGNVYGLMGTDHLRRDLLIGLVWGAPVALAFGMAAALMTVFSQVILGSLGAFYGGRWDEFVQRSADFFLIIPVLPILILVGFLYQPGILSILLIVVAFSIVGGTSKVARTIALQVREEMHIEAARTYGAPRLRILFKYVIPRAMPFTFATLALAVPSFIFLEAALSFLGVGDPILPTWGAIMGDASRNGAMYNGLWWWIAFPALGILFTTVAFAILGYAFDKVLNPRLREE